MKEIKYSALCFVFILLFVGTINGFDPESDHPTMTQFAIDSSSISDFLRDNLRITSSSIFDHPLNMSLKKNYLGLLKEGSSVADYEGNGDFDHYFDPTTQSGLNDGNHSGQSSLLLAQQYWQQAYDAYEDALTGQQDSTRNGKFGSLFLNLGRVLHLLQDLGDPAHTRNDGPVQKGTLNLTESSMAYVLANNNCGLEPPVEYDKLEQYWYNDDVSGYYPSPDPALATCYSPGLADRSNKTYFSENTLPDGTCTYMFPPTKSDDYPLEVCTSDLAPASYQCYLEPCMNFEEHIMFYKTLLYQQCLEAGECTISYDCNDASFFVDLRLGAYAYWNTQEVMAPYIIAYSAGLLDHFFQGELSVTIAPSSTMGYNDVTIINVSTSEADLVDGSLSFYWQKNDTREVVEIDSSSQQDFSLLYGDTVQFSIPSIPEELLEGQEIADTLYTVVYRGKMGNDSGTGFVGEMDAVIGKKVYPDVDRGRIYYVAEDSSSWFKSIRSIRHDGDDERTHYVNTHSCPFALESGSVSPDGEWVAFAETRDCVAGSSSAYICMMNTTTDQIQCSGPYAPTPQGYIPTASWNSESTEAVVMLMDGWDAAPGSHLWVMGIDGALRELAYSPTWGGWIWGGESRFSLDDSYVFFDGFGPDADPDIWHEDNKSVWKIPSEGGTIERISNPAFIAESRDVAAVISNPWTENILYAPRDSLGNSELWENGKNPSGATSHYQWTQNEMPFSSIYSMTMSPDQRYLSWVVGSTTNVYRILPEDYDEPSSGARSSANLRGATGFMGTPYWSPTSQRLAYVPDVSEPDKIIIEPISSDHTQQELTVIEDVSSEHISLLLGWGGGEAEKQVTIYEPEEGQIFSHITNPEQPINVAFTFSDTIDLTSGQFLATLTKGLGSFEPILINESNHQGGTVFHPSSTGEFEIKIEFQPIARSTDTIEDRNRITIENSGVLALEFCDPKNPLDYSQYGSDQITKIDVSLIDHTAGDPFDFAEVTCLIASLRNERTGEIVTDNPLPFGLIVLKENPNMNWGEDSTIYDTDVDYLPLTQDDHDGYPDLVTGEPIKITSSGYSHPILLKSWVNNPNQSMALPIYLDPGNNPLPVVFAANLTLDCVEESVCGEDVNTKVEQWVDDYSYGVNGEIRPSREQIIDPTIGQNIVPDWFEAKIWWMLTDEGSDRFYVLQLPRKITVDPLATYLGAVSTLIFVEECKYDAQINLDNCPGYWIDWNYTYPYFRRNYADNWKNINYYGITTESSNFSYDIIHHEARHVWQKDLIIKSYDPNLSKWVADLDQDRLVTLDMANPDHPSSVTLQDQYFVENLPDQQVGNPEFQFWGDNYYDLSLPAFERDAQRFEPGSIKTGVLMSLQIDDVICGALGVNYWDISECSNTIPIVVTTLPDQRGTLVQFELTDQPIDSIAYLYSEGIQKFSLHSDNLGKITINLIVDRAGDYTVHATTCAVNDGNTPGINLTSCNVESSVIHVTE